MFAGKECARALAKMSMDAKDCSAALDDLTPEQLKTLEDWEAKLKAKYPTVGQVRCACCRVVGEPAACSTLHAG